MGVLDRPVVSTLNHELINKTETHSHEHPLVIKRLIHAIRNLNQHLLSGSRASTASEQLLQQILRKLEFADIVDSERFNDPLRLLRHGYSMHSQNDEDGIIEEIFNRIGPTTKRFVEIGVEDGNETNTTKLLMAGWRGAWVEASSTHVSRIRKNFDGEQLVVLERHVTPDNADEIVTRLSCGEELDLLSIDIDSVDYWIWDAIQGVSPRVVVIEYNAYIRPPMSKTVPREYCKSWDGGTYFGASLSALTKLGQSKGYNLVGCNLAGVNAFFVRSDCLGDLFKAPFTAENHFEPYRFWLSMAGGHRKSFGRWEDV